MLVAGRSSWAVAKKQGALTFADIFLEWYERHAVVKLARQETERSHFQAPCGHSGGTAKSGTVFVADLDPQKSLTDLCERRSQAAGMPDDKPMLLENVTTVSSAVAALTKAGYERDYLVVDNARFVCGRHPARTGEALQGLDGVQIDR